jgi:hypothetical protein
MSNIETEADTNTKNIIIITVCVNYSTNGKPSPAANPIDIHTLVPNDLDSVGNISNVVI